MFYCIEMVIRFWEDIFSKWSEAKALSEACKNECDNCNDSTPNACKSCRRMVKELLIESNEKSRDLNIMVSELLLSALK